MALYSNDSNIMPKGGIDGYIMATDGVELRYAHWPYTAGIRHGTVCLFQGRSEFIEKYYEVIEELRARGFSVATLDWRGQGGSDRLIENNKKGHIKTFNQYLPDLDVFMREVVLPDCPPPYYALAHSMGGTILLMDAINHGNRFERMLLNAPMLGVAGMSFPLSWVQFVAWACCLSGLGESCLPTNKQHTYIDGFAGNRATSDPIRYHHIQRFIQQFPQISIDFPTISWLYAASKAMRYLQQEETVARIKSPTLIIANGGDEVVSMRAISRFCEQVKTAGFNIVAGARHEILFDRDEFREQFWASFDAFIPGSETGKS